MQAGSYDMLVAKREPFELGAHDRPVPHAASASTSSRFSRMLNVLQMLGALIAVPAGLGSAYTMYKTNFSPEASCQTLRANIVAMLDRSVDAATRRILVRRDVESFERTCGTVDPEATAAFKVLLAAKTGPAESWAPAPPQPVVRKIETAPPAKAESAAVTKVETKVEANAEKADSAPIAKLEPAATVKAEPAPAKAKPVPARTSVAVATPSQSEAPVSDAAWVAAVRSALVTPERSTASAPAPAPVSALPPPRALAELPPPQTLPSAQVLPSAPVAAPTLPPPAAIATVGAPANLDHPVPPGAIPEALPQDEPKKRSRVGEWVGEIPFFGKSLADHVTR